MGGTPNDQRYDFVALPFLSCRFPGTSPRWTCFFFILVLGCCAHWHKYHILAFWCSSRGELELFFDSFAILSWRPVLLLFFDVVSVRQKQTIISRRRGSVWFVSFLLGCCISRLGAIFQGDNGEKPPKITLQDAWELGADSGREIRGTQTAKLEDLFPFSFRWYFLPALILSRDENECTITLLDYRLCKGSHPSSPTEGRQASKEKIEVGFLWLWKQWEKKK